MSLSSFFLSPAQLKRGIVEQFWWVPKIQAEPTHHNTSDKGKHLREIQGSREQIITELTQKYDIKSNVFKTTDRNQIASVKAEKQDLK